MEMSTDDETGKKGDGSDAQGKGRRPRSRRYREIDIDWEGIADDLKSARPRQLSEREALERVAEELVEQHRRGITAEQMAEILGKRGLVVKVDQVREVLREFGDRGDSDKAA